MQYFVLVTGASTGIGASTCEELVKAGYQVLAGVRKEKDGSHLVEQFGPSVHPLLMDVTDEASIQLARAQSNDRIGNGQLVAIVNNAGIAVSGAILYVPVAEWQKQFEVNLFGMIRVTQHFFHLLIPKENDKHPRRIVNMGSVSGRFASPFLGPYAASKFALEALSDSLRRELFMYDIQVVIIQAGSIKTPLWGKAAGAEMFLGKEYTHLKTFKDKVIAQNLASALPVEQVSRLVVKIIRMKRVRARYLIKSGAWKFRLFRRIPDSWIDKLIRKKLKSQPD
jgi:NAD(P)-dependent dehydrogenase (short-subunit alcohol dehydrogenase family)